MTLRLCLQGVLLFSKGTSGPGRISFSPMKSETPGLLKSFSVPLNTDALQNSERTEEAEIVLKEKKGFDVEGKKERVIIRGHVQRGPNDG